MVKVDDGTGEVSFGQWPTHGEVLAAIWLEKWVVCRSKSSREHHFVNLGGLGERFSRPPEYLLPLICPVTAVDGDNFHVPFFLDVLTKIALPAATSNRTTVSHPNQSPQRV